MGTKNLIFILASAAGVALLTVLLSGPLLVPGPSAAPALPEPDDGAVILALSRLEARMGEINDRLRLLESRPLPEAGAPAAASPGSPAARPAQPVIPEVSFEDLSVEDLTKRAEGLRRLDARKAVAAYRALLERPLSPEQEAQAQLDLGMVYRYLTGESTHPQQKAAFERAIAVAGPDTDLGLTAAYMLSWTTSEMGDVRGALEIAERVTTSPGATELRRGLGHWAAGIFATELGDKDRAIREYQALLDTTHEHLESTRNQARQRMEALRRE